MKEIIYKDFLAGMGSGDLQPGSRIKSIREIAEGYNTALWQAQQAVKKLRNDGLLESRGRLGLYVRNNLSGGTVINNRCRISNRIMIILPSSRTKNQWDYLDECTKQLESVFSEKNYEVEYGTLPDNRDGLVNFLTRCHKEAYKSIIIFAEYNEYSFLERNEGLLDQVENELIIFNRGIKRELYLPCHHVTFDMHQEGRLAASYLIEQKIENIIFAGYPPPREMDWLSQRFDGVKAVCREKSANIDSIKMESSDIRAFNEIEKRIREASSKTALCIPTDAFAIPLIEYLKRKNMFAGKDYSLITFGNSSRGAKRLKLTTVIRPEETATKALIYLCVREKFSLPTEGKIVCRLRSRIIERDSVLRAGNENGQTKG